MNTITSDNPNFSPSYQLALSIYNISQTNALDAILQQFTTNQSYQPNDDELRLILNTFNQNHQMFLAADHHLEPLYTVCLQVLFKPSTTTSTTTTTTTTTSDLLAEFLPTVTTQLSSEPQLYTAKKAALLEFCLGNLLPTSGLCYDVINALLTLLLASYQLEDDAATTTTTTTTTAQKPIQTATLIQQQQQLSNALTAQQNATKYRNIDHILQLIPQYITQWGLQPINIATLYKATYDYQVLTATTFSSRSLLFSALQQFSSFDDMTLQSNMTWISSIVNEFFVMLFSLPSYQVSLDQYMAYSDIFKHPFITSTFFQQNFATFYQLLTIFNNTTTLAECEAVFENPSSPLLQPLSTIYGLNVENIRTNLVSLLIAEKLQAGKGFRFTTLQQYFQLDSIDQVEEYIVEATTHGQISTKIEQIKQIVYVSRVVPRKFNENTWAEVQKKLSHVNTVLTQALAQSTASGGIAVPSV